MFETLEIVITRLREIWAGMTLNQKVVSGAAIAALFGVALFMTTLSGSFADFTVLFAQLDSQSASQIAARLDEQDIPYKLSADGTVIEVPSDRVNRTPPTPFAT